MKRIRLVVNLIASWQLLLTLPCIYVVIMRIIQLEYWDTIRLRDQERMKVIIQANILTLFFTVLVFVLVFGSIGLYLKKNWGRKLSVNLFVMLIIFGCYTLFAAFSPVFSYSSEGAFIDVFLPILIFLILALTGILSTIYLTKPLVKEYFKKKPQNEPVATTSNG
jgi:hypothetical protein